MTDEERRRLADVERMIRDVHRAFMEPEPDGSPPMLARMSRLVTNCERGEWVAKIIIRGLCIAGAIAGALVAVKSAILSGSWRWW